MRVGDDVGVNMIAQVEPHSHRLRAGPVRVVVGDCRNPRRDREADGHRGGRADGVRRPRQLRRVGRGGEGPGIHHTPGVNGAETGMNSPGKLIEDVEQIAREFGGHDANLLIMVKRNRVWTGGNWCGFVPKSLSKKPIRPLGGRTKSVVWEVPRTGSPVALSHHGTSYTVGSWTEPQLRVLDRAPGPGARVDHSRRHDPFIGMARRVARLGPTPRARSDRRTAISDAPGAAMTATLQRQHSKQVNPRLCRTVMCIRASPPTERCMENSSFPCNAQ